jgi:hypothetical protein
MKFQPRVSIKIALNKTEEVVRQSIRESRETARRVGLLMALPKPLLTMDWKNLRRMETPKMMQASKS